MPHIQPLANYNCHCGENPLWNERERKTESLRGSLPLVKSGNYAGCSSNWFSGELDTGTHWS